MSYVVSFILGIVIAFTALIAHVFFGVIVEVVWHTTWQPHYDTAAPLWHVMPAMIVAACIEECLRVAVIVRKFYDTTLSPGVATLHGVSMGVGFWACEYALRYASPTVTTPLASALPPLAIHSAAGVAALLVVTQWRTATLPVRSIGALLCAIVLHTIGNSLIFLLH